MQHQREVRLGLVLYGGVSLAVYENGIVQELYRAIRGDGVYSLVKDLIDSDIVVDVISGTSAGGVNGVMLAFALANHREFTASADLWREQADIQQLLRTEKDPVATSLLNSTYYQQKLEECFQSNLKPDPSAPDVEELDLFVTGTDANGDIYTIYDDEGHPVDVKNHRALFKLAYRKGGGKAPRKNDFNPANATQLATLSRLTSCFPVAFEPVRIEKDDWQFFRWGKLRNPAVYLDGGILNNKPFTSTIDAISRRTANREVERFLIYVEPNPEAFPQVASESANPPSPTVVKAGMNALLSIPQYQSIAADLDAVEAHNERAQRIQEMFDALPEAPHRRRDDLDHIPVVSDYLETYDTRAYYAGRLIQLRDTAVTGILNDENGRAYLSNLDERRSGRILVESFNCWPGEPGSTLTEFDVFFRMRRAAYLSRMLMRHVKKGNPSPAAIWDVVNHYFKLYEMAQWALTSWLDAWLYPWRELSAQYPDLDTQPEEQRKRTLEQIAVKVWGEVEQHLRSLLYAKVDIPAETTAEARERFYEEISGFLKSVNQGGPAPADTPRNLLIALDDALKQWLASLPDDEISTLLRNEFCRFLEVDRQIFPVLLGSGFESPDTVHIVRFSPLDARRGYSDAPLKQKVCGAALSSFGGFFKKSWRASDIMMGRFDASCLLIECLMTKERLARMGAQQAPTATDLLRYFPKLDPAEAASLADAIKSYVSAPHIASAEQWSTMLDKIVTACHRQIYGEEWPRVQRCALEQEYAWSRYRQQTTATANPYDTKTLVWAAGKHKPDQVLVESAAAAISSGALPEFRPGVAVGQGFLDQVPGTVLEELGFLATIRLGKSLVASVPDEDKRKRIGDSKLYTWPFGIVTPVLYRWARMRRTQPDSIIILNTAIPAACIAVLLADLALAIVRAPLPWGLWLWFCGVPAALLIIWLLLFRKT